MRGVLCSFFPLILWYFSSAKWLKMFNDSVDFMTGYDRHASVTPNWYNAGEKQSHKRKSFVQRHKPVTVLAPKYMPIRANPMDR